MTEHHSTVRVDPLSLKQHPGSTGPRTSLVPFGLPQAVAFRPDNTPQSTRPKRLSIISLFLSPNPFGNSSELILFTRPLTSHFVHAIVILFLLLFQPSFIFLHNPSAFDVSLCYSLSVPLSLSLLLLSLLHRQPTFLQIKTFFFLTFSHCTFFSFLLISFFHLSFFLHI
ncbi:unnamed protein product [Acanthosepion pharaonis]|uniref:Transmembrane protein n=1 Tax=Acanthosepion pharaonis TaxID=158019 RepID=A0A812C0M7_ACAPH|nr:unnamed protein product [Sepia pharaonis]